MAVNLTFLKATTFQETITQPDSFLYKDLYLDLQLTYSKGNNALRSDTVVDLRPLTDIDAITTSVRNILLTSPGQKILNPTFGMDLRRFLFYPVNPRIGFLIGLEFSEQLPRFEPRIKIDNVDVKLLPDDNSYELNVAFSIPTLTNNKSFTLKGKLNSDGYTII